MYMLLKHICVAAKGIFGRLVRDYKIVNRLQSHVLKVVLKCVLKVVLNGVFPVVPTNLKQRGLGVNVGRGEWS